MSELAAWDSFYVIVGSAAGARISLSSHRWSMVVARYGRSRIETALSQ
jgi:hypothetical protein